MNMDEEENISPTYHTFDSKDRSSWPPSRSSIRQLLLQLSAQADAKNGFLFKKNKDV